MTSFIFIHKLTILEIKIVSFILSFKSACVVLSPAVSKNKECLISFFRQEEQKWLDALEKGELDDFGRVKQDKDVSMMTARQVGTEGFFNDQYQALCLVYNVL